MQSVVTILILKKEWYMDVMWIANAILLLNN